MNMNIYLDCRNISREKHNKMLSKIFSVLSGAAHFFPIKLSENRIFLKYFFIK